MPFIKSLNHLGFNYQLYIRLNFPKVHAIVWLNFPKVHAVHVIV